MDRNMNPYVTWKSNRTACGAYLIHDPSGVRMKSHIEECEDCQAILEREQIEWEREHD